MNDKPTSTNNKLAELGIPKNFVIANMPHKVVLEHSAVDSNGDCVFGYYRSVDGNIVLGEYVLDKKSSKEFQVPDEQIKNTFYHELFHAFNFYWNNEFSEELAQTFSNFMREYESTKK